MPDKLKRMLPAFLSTLLLAAGTAMPLAHALGLPALTAGAYCALLTAAAYALSLRRRLMPLAALAVALWQGALLFWGRGALYGMAQAAKAVALTLCGLPAALPLYAGEALLLLAVLSVLLALALTRASAGFSPALMFVLGVLLSLWFTGQRDTLLYALPALAGLIALAAQEHLQLPAAPRTLIFAAAIVLLAFALTPRAPLAQPQLQQMAQELRQMIADYFFYTEPREVFSLATEGFQPLGESQLGGPATPEKHAVMEVRAPQSVLLRGTIKNEYTGRAWRDTTGSQRYGYISPRFRALRASMLDMALPAAGDVLPTSTVSVHMLSGSASTLFTPQRVRALHTTGSMVAYFNNASELFLTRNLQAGDSYTVEAVLYTAGDPAVADLIDDCAARADDAYAQIAAAYMQVPSHMQSEIYEIAARITANYQTPYDKALALRSYLSRTFRYTLDAAAQPQEFDFVTWFLLSSREGYCTHFASAMTILCRMTGIPARYVEGYIARTDANGYALVTGEQAHAWTEIYLNGFGWLAIDATPAQEEGGDTPEPSAPPQEAATPTPEPAPTPSPEPLPEQEEETGSAPSPTPEPESEPDAPEEEERTPPPPFPWWLALLALAAALLALRVRLTEPARRAARAKTPDAALEIAVAGVLQALRLYALTPRVGETPLSFAARADKAGLPAALTPVAQAYSRARYSARGAARADTKLALSAYRALRGALPPHKRALLALRRCLTVKRRKKHPA